MVWRPWGEPRFILAQSERLQQGDSSQTSPVVAAKASVLRDKRMRGLKQMTDMDVIIDCNMQATGPTNLRVCG